MPHGVSTTRSGWFSTSIAWWGAACMSVAIAQQARRVGDGFAVLGLTHTGGK